MKRFINQMEPWFDEKERLALNDYMLEGGWLTEFKKTRHFEKMICDFTGAKYCFAVNNGTLSLSIAALAYDIKPGDQVIVPNYTMIATPNSLKLIGAEPVFVDVEPETLCLDINEVKKAITSKTKAIILVSANGRYPKKGIEKFVQLAKEYNLYLIEDAAQSLGSFYPNGKHIGRMGGVGSFSFSAPKIISTGQGGALITDNDELADKIRKIKDFGRDSGGNDKHDYIGFNFKFTEMQAVIGIEQMKKLTFRINRKKEIYELYRRRLSECKHVSLFENNIAYTTPWFYDMLCDNRDELAAYLKENGIGTRFMYPPINRQKAYNSAGQFTVTDEVGKKGLWLPSSSQLTDDDINYICNKIIEFYKNEYFNCN